MVFTQNRPSYVVFGFNSWKHISFNLNLIQKIFSYRLGPFPCKKCQSEHSNLRGLQFHLGLGLERGQVYCMTGTTLKLFSFMSLTYVLITKTCLGPSLHLVINKNQLEYFFFNVAIIFLTRYNIFLSKWLTFFSHCLIPTCCLKLSHLTTKSSVTHNQDGFTSKVTITTRDLQFRLKAFFSLNVVRTAF